MQPPLSWRRLGGGKTRVRGLYSRSRTWHGATCGKQSSREYGSNLDSLTSRTNMAHATCGSIFFQPFSAQTLTLIISSLFWCSDAPHGGSCQSQGLWLVGPAIDVGFLGDLTAAVKALTLVQGQGFHCGCNDLIHVLEAYYFKQKKAALLSVTL